jgi:hypothetical protein
MSKAQRRSMMSAITPRATGLVMIAAPDASEHTAPRVSESTVDPALS